MAKYLIRRTHTETYSIEIEAESEREAKKMAEDQIIDPGDYDLEDCGSYEYEVWIKDNQGNWYPVWSN